MTTWALFKNLNLGKKCFPLTEYGLVACLGCLGSFLALRLEDGQALATFSLYTSRIQCDCCRGRSGGHCCGQAPQRYGYQVIFFVLIIPGIKIAKIERKISWEIVWNKLLRHSFIDHQSDNQYLFHHQERKVDPIVNRQVHNSRERGCAWWHLVQE